MILWKDFRVHVQLMKFLWTAGTPTSKFLTKEDRGDSSRVITCEVYRSWAS